MELRGKTVLLTGASGGIGQAIALQLAAAGARLVLVARNTARLATLQAELVAKHPADHQIFSADLTNAQERQDLLAFVRDLQGIDLLINNAGISQFGLVAQQDYATQLSTNLLMPMLLTQTLLPELQRKSAAMIVNVGSAFGSIGYPGFTGYSASKFGLRGFTEALKRELSDSAVQVLYFAPRATDTSINSDAVVAMNRELGNQSDSPALVAAALVQQIQQNQARRFIGWPEQLFVRVNAVLPGIVDKALAAKLAVIRRYAQLSQP
ncbi:SDR family oxidoreductase [Rheinheimera tilapiae]|jgi:short-subunit dehydrogenase|uniref:SDR family oxidoreductase n=1 Tax=Rheinheimera tilapiae TaxID=875043 RepID=A0ABV6BER8_9GAMM